MPFRSDNIDVLRDALIEDANASKVCDAISCLGKMAGEGRVDAINLLIGYTEYGGVKHLHAYAMSRLACMADGPTKPLGDFFRDGINNPLTKYWAIQGYALAEGRGAFQLLTSLALDQAERLADRAQAIKCIAKASGCPFDRELPSDPGKWKAEDLRIGELLAWQNAGYPAGKGYGEPIRDSGLDDPKSELEKAVAGLDRKLSTVRQAKQDLAQPANWLSPAAPELMELLNTRFTFPPDYEEFLSRFSPIRVTLQRGPSTIFLFGATELVRAQDGYSFNPIAQEVILDWPDDYLVIAAKDGDPFVLDLRSSNTHSTKVLHAAHGIGAWSFREYARSFVEFLNRLAQ